MARFDSWVISYAEGIDVLYGTNTIVIDSEPLMLHLPQLTLPQRLRSITSLELLIKAHVHMGRTENGSSIIVGADFNQLPPVLEMLPAHFKSLRRLHLSLHCGVYAPPDRIELDGTLSTIDACYRSMRESSGQLQTMTIELPRTSFGACEDRANRMPAEHAYEEKERACVWRCFEGEKLNREPELQWRMASNYPEPPLQLPSPDNEGRRVASSGYWIFEGNDDKPMYMVSCFGT